MFFRKAIHKMNNYFDNIEKAYKNYFNFSGRSKKTEYVHFVMFFQFCFMITGYLGVLSLVKKGIISKVDIVFAIGLGIVFLLSIIPAFAVQFRRLHDIGRRGVWSFIPVISCLMVFVVTYIKYHSIAKSETYSNIILIVTWLFLFEFSMVPSDKKANKYGEP